MNDPCVEEVRRIRDVYAKQFNYDIEAIYEDLKDQEKKSELTYVTLPPERVEVDAKAESTPSV